MPFKRILLTGDDGYNSIGIRLLIRALRDKYQLQIAATKQQQSGVGGMLSLRTGGTWGETTVDKVPVLWVDGTPADVIEMGQGYFKKPFDLIISGVNMGANVSSAVISSGTYCAALRGISLNLAPRAIAMSWDTPSALWHKNHDEAEDISAFHDYPGNILASLLEQCIDTDLWGAPVLNINLPKQATRTVRFTKMLKDPTKYFTYPIAIDSKHHRFSFERPPFNIQVTDLKYDAAALMQGYISITPCAFEMTHFTTYEQVRDKQLEL